MNLENEKKPFYPLSEFPSLHELQSKYPIIQKELQQNQIWMKWGSDSYDPTGHCMFLSGDWTVCPIYFGNYSPFQMAIPGMDSNKIKELISLLPSQFPQTIELLSKIPSLNFSAFSRLHPKSKLAPHKHKNPLSLIFHMGIIIPAGKSCGLKVGEETHLWTKPGDAIIFDDNLEHSAWNDSEEERIILYIDFKRHMQEPKKMT